MLSVLLLLLDRMADRASCRSVIRPCAHTRLRSRERTSPRSASEPLPDRTSCAATGTADTSSPKRRWAAMTPNPPDRFPAPAHRPDRGHSSQGWARSGRPSHGRLTNWPDGTGPGRTVWASSGPWSAATDFAALIGGVALIYGSEGWGFESLRARPGQRPVPIMECTVAEPLCSNWCSSPAHR